MFDMWQSHASSSKNESFWDPYRLVFDVAPTQGEKILMWEKFVLKQFFIQNWFVDEALVIW